MGVIEKKHILNYQFIVDALTTVIKVLSLWIGIILAQERIQFSVFAMEQFLFLFIDSNISASPAVPLSPIQLPD